MIETLSILHIILSILVVVLVLIQDPKGGGVGGMFGGGGGSDSLFGATGAPSFLSKVTKYVAVFFAASCIAMTIVIRAQHSGSGGVLQNRALPVPKANEPVAPADSATPGSETAVPSMAEPKPAEPKPE